MNIVVVSVIAILLLIAAVFGLALYASFVYPVQRHRAQLKTLIRQIYSRPLSEQENKALSHYLALTPSQYNQLLGDNACRNDMWTGHWHLISQEVYLIEAVIHIEELESLWKCYRIGQIQSMRFNVPPIWERKTWGEPKRHRLEFVLTDQLPIIISFDGHTLWQGVQIMEEYLESKEAINAFQSIPTELDPAANTASSQQTPHEENQPASAAAPTRTYIAEQESDDPASASFQKKATSNASSYGTSSVAKSEQTHPSKADLNSSSSKAAHLSSEQTQKNDNSHNEHNAQGFIVTQTRQMSRDEALAVYGPKYHTLLALAFLVFSTAVVWSGTQETSVGEALTVLAMLVWIGTLVAWKTLPYWITCPTVKTLQGPLTARTFHLATPNQKELGIGDLTFEPRAKNRGLAAILAQAKNNVLSLGHRIEVELTPERYILSYQGQSCLPYYHRPKLIRYWFYGVCATLLMSLALSHLLKASLDIPAVWKGPHYITLSMLEEAHRYHPQEGDVLTLEQLPVLCQLDEIWGTNCGEVVPGQLPVIDPRIDKQRLKQIASIRYIFNQTYNGYPIYSLGKPLLFFIPNIDEQISSLKTLCGADQSCSPLIDSLEKAKNYQLIYGEKNRVGLTEEQYRFQYDYIRTLLRMYERQATRHLSAALDEPRAHAPWQIDSFLLGYRHNEYHVYQDKPFQFNPQQAFETPEKTGDTPWDDILERRATYQGGSLTVTGQVENLRETPLPTFALNRMYYIPTLWPIVLAILTWLVLLGAAIQAGLTCKRHA